MARASVSYDAYFSSNFSSSPDSVRDQARALCARGYESGKFFNVRERPTLPMCAYCMRGHYIKY